MSEQAEPCPTPAIPGDTLAFFQSQPWTKSLLESPSYQQSVTAARVVKESTEDAFFSQTLATPSTIPHSLTLIHRTLPDLPHRTPITATTSSFSLPVPEEPDCLWLIALGSPGISGHPFTAHGGFLTAVLDEIMGCTVCYHLLKKPKKEPSYTVNLNTNYKKPVKVPCVLVASAWCTGQHGRKWYARGQLKDEDGNLYTEAEGIWVETRPGQL